jgi:signal transduction histidine kinase
VVTLVSVVLLGVPLGIVGARLVRDEAAKRVNGEAASVAHGIDMRTSGANPLSLAVLERVIPEDRHVTVSTKTGAGLEAGVAAPTRAIHGQASTKNGDLVTVSAPDGDVREQVRTVWLVVGALGLLATIVGLILATLQARRLSRPLLDLAASAEGIGSVEPVPGRRYGMAEVDQVAERLDATSERIAQMLRREREFAADASHQLRTPLTALSIRLEEIMDSAVHPDVKEEASAALAQVERLTAVVDSLLAQARNARAATALLLDVDDIVLQQVVEWAPAFRRVGRKIVPSGERGLKAYSTPGNLGQALSSLLDNALVHGAGTVTLRRRRHGRYVVIEVADEGVGIPEAMGQRVFERAVSGGASTGLGLALARDVIEADGGRVELVRMSPPVFAIFLRADTADQSTDARSGSGDPEVLEDGNTHRR